VRRARPRFPSVLVALALLAGLAAGCGGSEDDGQQVSRPQVTLWSLEFEPDRVAATRANVAEFTRRTGIRVAVGVIGDGALPARMAEALDQGRVPDVVQMPLDSVHEYANARVLDEAASEDVIDRLGDDTFSQTALTLVTREGRIAAVPSDGWGQLLVYRKDLFRQAGLSRPETVEDIRAAARRLDRGGRAGITLGTTPDQFTSETFEHVALAMGCNLVDDQARILLDSPECRAAFRYYVDLARNYSVGGVQDVESTRDAYMAGRAAMILWSPFLLDALAGLRDDAQPTCPECREDPAYLARNSEVVGALSTKDGKPSQYASVTTWAIPRGADVEPAKRLVEYLLSDGYLRWLALSPQGKYPLRAGDVSNPTRFFDAWERLKSGVDRKARLREFYSESAMAAIRDGTRRFRRWGFDQGQAALVGAMRGPQPVSRALARAIAGEQSADQAATQARIAVERVQRGQQ